MMHKNDPYTVSLALSESNRRKQMRDAAQGQQGMAPQPKVVDQGIAGMAAPAPQPMPEDVGIGALPAPNMQRMAEGGIVAFSGQDASVVQDMSPDAINERYRQAQLQKLKDLFGFTGYSRGFQSGFTPEEKLTGIAAPVTGPTPVVASSPASVISYKPDTAGEALAQARVAAPAVKLTPVPGTGGPRPAPAPAASLKQLPQAGLGDLATTYSEILKKQDFKDPAEARLGDLEKKERAAAEENKAALMRDQAKFDDAYKGREKRLSDRELDIGKQKDTNTGLAFLNAGLAIMSTPGGLATAIGKGAQVGTAQFAAGLDKIRSAQERLDDARDKMEDLKLNRAEMSAKEIRTAEKDIRNVGIDAEKRGIDGLRMAADVNRRTAADMFKATVDVGVNRERMESAQNIAEMQEKGQSSRSAAQIAATLNTPDRLVFDKLLKDNNNDAVAAATELQKMKIEKFSVTTAYADYLKAFAGKDTLKEPDSFEVFAKRFIPTVTPNKNTTVRTQPGG